MSNRKIFVPPEAATLRHVWERVKKDKRRYHKEIEKLHEKIAECERWQMSWRRERTFPFMELWIEDLHPYYSAVAPLAKAGITTVKQLVNLTEEGLAALPGVGPVRIEEIKDLLQKHNVHLKKQKTKSADW